MLLKNVTNFKEDTVLWKYPHPHLESANQHTHTHTHTEE